jgi:hypothetical protein
VVTQSVETYNQQREGQSGQYRRQRAPEYEHFLPPYGTPLQGPGQQSRAGDVFREVG